MKTTRLNSDVIDLFDKRKRLLAELEEIEVELSTKRRLLVAGREIETAAHDVRRCTERRASCAF